MPQYRFILTTCNTILEIFGKKYFNGFYNKFIKIIMKIMIFKTYSVEMMIQII